MLGFFEKFEKSDNLFFKKIENTHSIKAIVFLHGLGGSHRYWKEEYKSLAKDFNLYFVDLLGFGYSAKPHTIYSLEKHIQALKEFIDKEVTEREIFFVGHSLGAIVGLGYTHKYQHKIKKVIVLSLPYYINEAEAAHTIKKWRNNFLYTNSFFPRILCTIHYAFPWIFLISVPYFFPSHPRQIVHDALLHTPNSYFSTLQNVIIKQNIASLLNTEIVKKVIVLLGEDDQLLVHKNYETLISQASVEVIKLKGEQHNFPLKSPQKVIDILHKYID